MPMSSNMLAARDMVLNMFATVIGADFALSIDKSVENTFFLSKTLQNKNYYLSLHSQKRSSVVANCEVLLAG